MNKTKLKIKVNIYDEKDDLGGRVFDVYCVSFKFLDIDKTISDNSYVSYLAKNGFSIEYSNNVPSGFLRNSSMNLPRPDKLGLELKRTFFKEKDRYEYIKKVYEALKYWVVNMYNFDGIIFINNVKFKLDNDLWIIEEKNNKNKEKLDDLYNHQKYNNICM